MNSKAQRRVEDVVSVPATSRSSVQAMRCSSRKVSLPLSFMRGYVSATGTVRVSWHQAWSRPPPRILAEIADPLHAHPADGWPEPNVCPELIKGHTGSSDGEFGLDSHPF